ncbi:unnamed protein product [Prunus armeniaca]|uniref:Uncharacterized protein n=1 Tax=Prunus armeniaca TaxID=36596 RepID=A0A6J5VAV2_PRUAR|nr:unnamed protein product [Prunus armeniaca]
MVSFKGVLWEIIHCFLLVVFRQVRKASRTDKHGAQGKTEALLTNWSGATSRLVFKQKARQLDN